MESDQEELSELAQAAKSLKDDKNSEIFSHLYHQLTLFLNPSLNNNNNNNFNMSTSSSPSIGSVPGTPVRDLQQQQQQQQRNGKQEQTPTHDLLSSSLNSSASPKASGKEEIPSNSQVPKFDDKIRAVSLENVTALARSQNSNLDLKQQHSHELLKHSFSRDDISEGSWSSYGSEIEFRQHIQPEDQTCKLITKREKEKERR